MTWCPRLALFCAALAVAHGQTFGSYLASGCDNVRFVRVNNRGGLTVRDTTCEKIDTAASFKSGAIAAAVPSRPFFLASDWEKEERAESERERVRTPSVPPPRQLLPLPASCAAPGAPAQAQNMHFDELQVWTPWGVNAALGGVASSSSTLGAAYPASRAIDNVFVQNSAESFFHSAGTGTSEFWQVDLGATYIVSNLTLYNRCDNPCCRLVTWRSGGRYPVPLP